MNDSFPRDVRPRWHFAPQRFWMNDPNGLFHHNGTWHLFFQHNPLTKDWGNMSWGHATSQDLLTWTEREVAIPYRAGEAIYSGSAVVDHENTSGLGDGERPPILAVFTSAYSSGLQAQSLAVSRDGGDSFTRVGDGPVLDRGSEAFRDPKVFRFVDDEGSARWIMVAVEAGDHQVLIHSSPDLQHWTHESSFGPFGPGGGEWECPDLFPLDLDGDPARRRWVLLLSLNPGLEDPAGTSMVYFVGTFDGHTFVPDDDASFVRLDHGRDFYAAVSFDNVPDGRRIIIGWMNNWRYSAHTPTHPWRGVMSLPRELLLRTIDGVPRLVQHPVLPRDPDRVFQLDWDSSDPQSIDLLVGDRGPAARLSWDPSAGTLSLDRTVGAGAGFHPDFPSVTMVELPPRGGERLELTVVADAHLVEVFADGGAVTISEQAFG